MALFHPYLPAFRRFSRLGNLCDMEDFAPGFPGVFRWTPYHNFWSLNDLDEDMLRLSELHELPRLLFTAEDEARKQKKPKVWKELVTMKGFTPDEVEAKLTDNKLELHASKKTEFGEHGMDLLQGTRYVSIPEDVDPETLHLRWRGDGTAIVSGKRKEEPKEIVQKKEDVPMETDGAEKKPEEKSREISLAKPAKITCQSEMGGVVQDAEGNKFYQLNCDLQGFDEKDVKVKVNGDRVHVSAEHSEENENGLLHLKVGRMFTLPKSTDMEQLKTSFENGKLAVLAPLKDEQAAAIKQ